VNNQFKNNVLAYEMGRYDLIFFTDKVTKESFAFHPKQIDALKLLNDNKTTFIGYGGAARGGKSALMAADAIFCCHAYPNTSVLVGRKNLTILWETTWKTLLRMLNNFEFVEGIDFKYNGQKHELIFTNGSMILAKNLEIKPSDIEATDFGSLEILRAYIDQSEHVPIKIIEKVSERTGSHYTAAEYGLIGKTFEAFNPSAGHVKRRYWVPFRDKTEKKRMKFVRALPADNPGREAKQWVLEKEKDFHDGLMSIVEYQKQILGNFDYDDNPDRLINFDDIISSFTNNHLKTGNNKYITADIARLGSDKAVIYRWDGWIVIERIEYDKSKLTLIQDKINELRQKHGIPAKNCIADEDGVGGGVVDNCNIKGFVNNSVPLKARTGTKDKKTQYKNLKTQCGYGLAGIVTDNKLYYSCALTETIKQRIVEELEQLQSFKIDDDGRLRLKPKIMIKADIGRSPDDLDTLLMRYYFELDSVNKIKSFAVS
jgi:hypothetical protein